MLKKLVIILIALCSVEFFTIILVPEVIQKVADVLGISIILFFLVLFSIYDRTPGIPRNFTLPIVLIYSAMIISMLAALAFWDQSLPVTLWAQKALYFYLIYFLLSKLRPHPDFIIDMIIALGVVFMVIYIVQNIVYPFEIVSYRLFVDRGTIRIFMPGGGYRAVVFDKLGRLFLYNGQTLKWLFAPFLYYYYLNVL